MRNNILGGLVIFMVVVTCLLMIDDISNTKQIEIDKDKTEVKQVQKENDLAIIEAKE